MLRKTIGAILATLSFSANSMAQEMIYPDTMVVLDVSNSMWGQINGVSKMEIAREVISDMVNDLATDSEFGLIAYGHRTTSDCGDIELILPVGPLDPGQFSNAINGLQPQGRTPLTAAVRMAAEVLDSENRSARIILLSDGLESCDQDPCALATELEAAGLDFTTHVIGFGVADIDDQSQLSCLAENTGGLYLTAESTEELTSALQVMAMPAAITAPHLILQAVDSDGTLIEDPSIEWSVYNVTDQDMWLEDKVAASVSIEYRADVYRITAALDGRIGTREITFDGETDATFSVLLPRNGPTGPTPTGVETVAIATVDAPNNPDEGAEISVTWTGPSNLGDYLAIALPDALITSFSDYARTSAGNPASLTAPDQPGTYEVRYISPTTSEILATNMIIVGPISVELDAPDEIDAGSVFSVNWQGPGFDNDSLALVPQGAELSDAVSLAPLDGGSPTSLVAPSVAGEYEIQYFDSDGLVLESRLISIIYTGTLAAVPTAVAGSEITVDWTGPGLSGDFITIVDVSLESPETGNISYTADGAQLKLLTPDVPGEYELQYVTGETNIVVTSLPISLTAPEVSINATDEAIVGSELSMTWQGPNNKNDLITVVPVGTEAGEYNDFAFARQGSPMTLQLPDSTGDYEIRYVSGQSGRTLASAEISLIDIPVVLEAAPAVVKGDRIDVIWEGPDKDNDFVTIVPVDSDDDVFTVVAYTRDGPQLTIQAPEAVGDYEIRYVSGQSGAMLKSLPVTVITPPTSLAAPNEAIAGSAITVNWEGPDSEADYIAIVPVGAGAEEYGNYAYTREGSPMVLRTLDAAGDFEIRYISAESKEVLKVLPITLIAYATSLQAVSEIVAGAEISVDWDGPNNLNDFVTVVPTGAAAGDYGNYSYTREGTPMIILTTDIPGDFEIRYVSGQSYTTLASIPIKLVSPVITIDASPVGIVGNVLEVVWSGPDNKNDFLTVVAVGADEGEFGGYRYTRQGNPLELSLPNEAGSYEIRYVSGQSTRTLGILPLAIIE